MGEFVPSVKGVTMLHAIRRMRSQIERGAIKESQLDACLEEGDRAFIDQRIAPTLWYPIDCYARMMMMLRDAEGGSGNDYWIQFGRETALEVVQTTPVQIVLKGARPFGPRAGMALIKMSSLFYNFGSWKFTGEILDDFVIESSGVSDLPELSRFGTLGFIQYFAEEFLGHSVPMTSIRPQRDKVIYKTLV